MIGKNQLAIKRGFDFTLALLCLPVLILPIVALILFSSIDLKSFGLFRQDRVGQNGKIFKINKIKTFKPHMDRPSKFGQFLRKTKLDELPQVFNVLFGTMSFVGPRPDLLGQADQLSGGDRIILKVKPGITGPATLKYRNEENLLTDVLTSETEEYIWKDKVRINKNYANNWSFYLDLQILIRTISMKKYE